VRAQKQGQALIDSLIKELPKIKESSQKVSVMDDLSYEFCSINPDEGLRYGQEGLEMALKLHNDTLIALVYSDIALNYQYKSEYDKALENYFIALKMDSTIGKKNNYHVVMNNIGIVYEKQSKYPLALEYFFKALKGSEETGNNSTISEATNNIGIVYIDQKNYPKAREYFSKALKIHQETGNRKGESLAKANIGLTYELEENFSNAIENYEAALKIDEELGDKSGVAMDYGNIGSAYRGYKNYEKSIEYSQKAVDIFDEMGDKNDVAIGLNNIASAYLEIAKDTFDRKIPKAGKRAAITKAIGYSKRSLEISKAIQSPDVSQLCYGNLKIAYEMTGDYKKALESSDSFNAIQDTIFSNDNKVKMANLATKREEDLKEKQIAINKLITEKKKSERLYFSVGFALMLVVVSGLFISRKAIKKEKNVSEELLLNILPAEVAEELKTKGSSEARLFNNVTVLFTDFVNFTGKSEHMSPQQLVDELDSCFKAFDEITNKYKIEKIKTIGDAYLAVSGLPVANTNHAENIVKAAIEISAFMKDRRVKMGDKTFLIRIGVHSGSVVAGIVGIKKYAYDIWGDTVNTAARMEQNSEPERVNISETTYELVKDKFNCTYRGEIEAKNKGMLKMYYVG
jgi:class 3 adenylate cyclase